jgi:tetratricopeptide (TPR) repeat protein
MPASFFVSTEALSTTKPVATEGAEQVSRDWKRITAGDLIAVGDASENDLRESLLAIEQFRAMLRELFPRVRFADNVPTVLVVFKNDDALHRFKPRDARGRRIETVAGYFFASADANFMVLGNWREREATLEILLHEYTHYVMYRNTRRLPYWLNEGLAEFYSTFRTNYRDGRSVIGRAPPGHAALVAQQPLIPLAQLLRDEHVGRILQEGRRVGMLYAQSWALVHYLNMGRRGQPGTIGEYLRALENNAPEDAFTSTFKVSLAEMEDGLRRYMRQFQLPIVLVAKPEAAPGTDLRGARMLEAEARLLQGDLLLRLGDLSGAESEIDQSLRIDPSSIPAKIALGRLRDAQDRDDEGIVLLTEAATTDSASFAAQFYLGSALASRKRHGDAIAAFDRALKLVPRSPSTWFGLSMSRLALGRRSQSDAALAGVIALDSSPSWYRARAYAAYEHGAFDVAASDGRQFLTAAGWGDVSAPYIAFLTAIADWRMNRDTEAGAVLQQSETAVQPNSWTAVVLSYLQDRITANAFIAKASNTDERTEAYAYAGIKALIAGRLEEARKHLEWVSANGNRNFVEYDMAKADLQRLTPPAAPQAPRP